MTKDEIINIAMSYQALYDYVEKFMTERYLKLCPLYDNWGTFSEMDINLDNNTIRIVFDTSYMGCSDAEVVRIPIDYLTMTDEQILKDLSEK